jgi:hypothetical protein
MPQCSQCQVIRINGIRCHEQRCPEAWRDEVRECAWCGQEFEPQDRSERCCSADCEDCYRS